ncbi:MAG: LanC-like protein [Myxococcota bacterium]
MQTAYDRARHRPLDAEAWSPERARGAIRDIVADFEAALRPDGSWPTHPWEAERRDARWCQYNGAAGAVSALRILRRGGHRAPDHAHLLPQIHARYLRAPDEGYETGLQLGEIGILAPAVAAGVASDADAARLADCMKRTVGHPAREITSGETGMMHAALTLYRETGDARWAEHYRAGAESLFAAWERQVDTGTWLWTSDVFGSVRRYYGACHGVAGNAGVLLRGAELLPAAWLETGLSRATEALRAGALESEAGPNWPVGADPSGTRRLVQWCHGAGGVVAALGDAPRTESAASKALDALLARAGELVWEAGPVAKGPGVCHGTAGNGYAFLALYRRTGDPLWRDRARRFAMHGIGQRERGRARHGQGKYTLWTGDGGFAVYLHHVLCQEDGPAPTPFPGLETF